MIQAIVAIFTILGASYTILSYYKSSSNVLDVPSNKIGTNNTGSIVINGNIVQGSATAVAQQLTNDENKKNSDRDYEDIARIRLTATQTFRRHTSDVCTPWDKKSLSEDSLWFLAEKEYEFAVNLFRDKKYKIASVRLHKAFNLYQDICLEFEKSRDLSK